MIKKHIFTCIYTSIIAVTLYYCYLLHQNIDNNSNDKYNNYIVIVSNVCICVVMLFFTIKRYFNTKK